MDRKFHPRLGNIGEMRNVIKRAVILSAGPALPVGCDLVMTDDKLAKILQGWFPFVVPLASLP